MKITFLLHFYQPHNQQKDILQRIVNESYLPITRGLLAIPRAKAVININAALTELLHDHGYTEVLDNLAKLADEGRIELTGSAKYHAFLPLLPKEEVTRQININTSTNKKYIHNYTPEGFFPPEMAVNRNVLDSLDGMGYLWTCAPELAHPAGKPERNKLYKDKDSGLYIMFRHKRVSTLVLSAICRDAKDLVKETQDIHDQSYWFCVMDAETFGHHRIGHEKLLLDIMKEEFFEPCLVKDLLKSGLSVEETEIRASTWTNEEQDFWLDKEKTKPSDARSFILWKDPENPIHKLQWELTDLAVEMVRGYENKEDGNYIAARDALDKATASDQYWWASAKPWWSLEMIEQGAHSLLEVFKLLKVEQKVYERADSLYRSILDQAFEWQRTGYIRERHLNNSSTFMSKTFKDRTPHEWYNQIVLEFEDEMKKAADKREFEKAVKWRDALMKLEQGSDIYDVLHVVDELWSARQIPSVKPFLSHEWEEFSEFAKKNFLDVPDKASFEEWKKKKEKESKS